MRLWMLRRLKGFGANHREMVDVYEKQIRSIMEQAVPVWEPGLTKGECEQIERVQKCAFSIILGDKYTSYRSALRITKLETLFERRRKLCATFGKRSVKHSKFKNWFKSNPKYLSSRSKQPKFKNVFYRTERYRRSPVSYLTETLNQS